MNTEDVEPTFFALDQALQSWHYGFIYDADDRAIDCKECGWTMEGVGFLEAVRLHADHRRRQKHNILATYIAANLEP